MLTGKERREKVSFTVCENADGTFLPPVLILTGVGKNPAILYRMNLGLWRIKLTNIDYTKCTECLEGCYCTRDIDWIQCIYC